MGVIYTPEQLSSGRIPDETAHRRAGRFIIERFSDLHAEAPDFRGGMIYGSAHFNPTIRSDLDILTVLDPSVSPQTIDQILAIYREVGQQFSVQPEANTLLLNEKSSWHDHKLDALFGVHLEAILRDNPESAVGDFRHLLKFDELSPEKALAIVHEYAVYKERRFVKSLTHTGEGIDYARLQRAFELPSALGRKAIAAFSINARVDYAQLGRDRLSTECLDILSTQTLNENAHLAHTQLATNDATYTQLLHDTLVGDVSLDDYEGWLADVSRPAIHNARVLSTAWKQIISARQNSVSTLI